MKHMILEHEVPSSIADSPVETHMVPKINRMLLQMIGLKIVNTLRLCCVSTDDLEIINTLLLC
jgi:hypothetical protein